ncbi:outer membrane lipoprotein-sorting protein [Brevibacillus marinus]|jgi:outer membrane lipoprotein-sorting protein|uniref:outer membrane lipoprotein-sorting protein n=1 Tax=Brevibacillus marinus TaxID=2496837 RepID=UPI000F816964|nr:outer membrane lipoprotein-sorting protein [Brevibacillus marinus]
MKRGALWLAIVLILSVMTAGCFGTKSPEDVIGELSSTLEKMSGYKTNAVLTLQTGSTPQEYDVEVWYQKPANYRVALTSKQRNITQIILRNDEGVFVLTPHLNKSFRFQSGWPENNGPLYLYETLVRSILDDSERKVNIDDKQYVFEVKANYSGNRSLTKQKIWLTEDFKPTHAEIMDGNMNTMVEISFADFVFNPQFDEDAFDKDRNMQTALMALPTFAQGNKEEPPTGSFGVIHPTYVPQGVKLAAVEPVERGEDYSVVLQYEGAYQYKLLEARPTATTVSYDVGMPVNLGFTIGVLTGTADQQRMLTWELDGVEFTLVGNLPEDEMVKIANSTYGVSGK